MATEDKRYKKVKLKPLPVTFSTAGTRTSKMSKKKNLLTDQLEKVNTCDANEHVGINNNIIKEQAARPSSLSFGYNDIGAAHCDESLEIEDHGLNLKESLERSAGELKQRKLLIRQEVIVVSMSTGTSSSSLKASKDLSVTPTNQDHEILSKTELPRTVSKEEEDVIKSSPDISAVDIASPDTLMKSSSPLTTKSAENLDLLPDDGKKVKSLPMTLHYLTEHVVEGPLQPRSRQYLITAKELLVKSQETDYRKVNQVCLHAAGLDKLPSLVKFVNLRILDLSCNHLSDIGNLRYAKLLKDLKLYDNNICEITGLDNLKELSYLQLQHNQIHRVGTVLTSCKYLRMLRLDHNYIERLEECEFAGLNMLNYLDISNNKIKSIYALRVLPSLDDLYVARNRVTDLIGIFHFKRLQELDIAHNRLCSLDGFQGHMRITILRLSHNRLSDVVIAAKLPSLLELDISHNRLHSVATMRDQFVNLEALNVTHNRVNSMQDLKTLAVMPNLVELSVKGNPAVKGLTRKALLKAIPRLMVLNQRIVKSNVAAWKKSTSDMASDVSGAHLKMVADEIDTLEETTFAYKTALEHKITRLRIAAATLPGPQPRPEMEEKPESLPRLRSRSQMARSFPLSSKDSMEFNF